MVKTHFAISLFQLCTITVLRHTKDLVVILPRSSDRADLLHLQKTCAFENKRRQEERYRGAHAEDSRATKGDARQTTSHTNWGRSVPTCSGV